MELIDDEVQACMQAQESADEPDIVGVCSCVAKDI